jgi:DNA-binding NarL/FixJ family response regulator
MVQGVEPALPRAPAREILCARTGEGPRQIRPYAKIGILTRHDHMDLFLRARRQRLNGFILKKDSPDELSYAIRTMLAGGFYTPPSMSSSVMAHTEPADAVAALTQREKSVLSLYAQGYSMKEIANCLNVSVKTAETHRNNLGRKLGHLKPHTGLLDPLFGWKLLLGNTHKSIIKFGCALFDRSAFQE